jgi:membrane protein YdbS with pleckstrin-like domain
MAESNAGDRTPEQSAMPQGPAASGDDRPHKPADDREEVYFEGSPQLRAEVARFVVAGLIAAALIAVPILFRIYKPGVLPWWGAVVLVVAAVVVMVIPIWLTKSVRYRISNYRIDYERGILSKNIDTLELWHVEDIQFHQSLLDRILGVGTITVISHDDTTPELRMEGIPNPRPLFESLKQRVIAVKRQRGVVKMDLG